ncbi:putative phytosulfokine [Trifolium repens]|nr:putative phytosulfokine [Trifolium repens]
MLGCFFGFCYCVVFVFLDDDVVVTDVGGFVVVLERFCCEVMDVWFLNFIVTVKNWGMTIGNTIAQSSTEMKEDKEERMGSEECYDEKDEECSRRRMIAEAHLDYIYTQDHKP